MPPCVSSWPKAHGDNERLAQVVQGIEEREAAACPEDVGFEEYIRTLQQRLAQVEKELATTKQHRDDLIEELRQQP